MKTDESLSAALRLAGTRCKIGGARAVRRPRRIFDVAGNDCTLRRTDGRTGRHRCDATFDVGFALLHTVFLSHSLSVSSFPGHFRVDKYPSTNDGVDCSYPGDNETSRSLSLIIVPGVRRNHVTVLPISSRVEFAFRTSFVPIGIDDTVSLPAILARTVAIEG